ncbi:hypothetical protein ACFYKX_04725 [Cytobacillus sp. FJAT-54145]|uniref:Uncharacterized protein n=1 Tax=Cytobacillus spartinae TaxID=3299023 RepID=A0ABW6K864_9BACI
MKKKLKLIFHILTFIGVVSFTLAFFNVGREVFDKYLVWFLGSLWVGTLGNFFINKATKKQENG